MKVNIGSRMKDVVHLELTVTDGARSSELKMDSRERTLSDYSDFSEGTFLRGTTKKVKGKSSRQ